MADEQQADFVRAYVFLERKRSIRLKDLEPCIARWQENPASGVVTWTSVWGQYDAVVVIEKPSIEAVHEAIDKFLLSSDDSVGDLTTFIAIRPEPLLGKELPNGMHVVAFDARPRLEFDLRDKLINELSFRGLRLADVVFGNHDLIGLFDASIDAATYSKTYFPVYETCHAILKTRTMFSLPVDVEDVGSDGDYFDESDDADGGKG